MAANGDLVIVIVICEISLMLFDPVLGDPVVPLRPGAIRLLRSVRHHAVLHWVS
jgi:hypothetical protein